MKEEIVGHKTMTDGSHVPLYKSEADALWASVMAAKAKREADMPTEKEALDVMFQAFQRLRELGWSEAIYCPKDGSMFDAIEAGSTGIHDCSCNGEWPKGTWWIHAEADMWPSHPILYKAKPTNNGERDND